MKLHRIECPYCGARLTSGSDRTKMFCSYCGGEIFFDDGTKRIENFYHKKYTNEAKIRDCERIEKVQLRKIEQKENERKWEFRETLIPFIAMVIGFVLLMLIGLYDDYKSRPTENEICIPASAEEYEGEPYAQVAKELQNAGFTNIDCDPMGDLKLGILKKPGAIDKVSIDGDFQFTKGDIFSEDAKVVISYHSKKK